MDDATLQTSTTTLREFYIELTRPSACDMLHLMRRADLSMPQLVTLLFLHRHGAASISDIGAHLNLSLGATSHLVDRLFSAGFVGRAEDPNDRRQKQVTLTEAGQAFVQEFNQARVEDMTRRLDRLPPTLLDNLLDAMTAATTYLREHDLPMTELDQVPVTPRGAQPSPISDH